MGYRVWVHFSSLNFSPHQRKQALKGKPRIAFDLAWTKALRLWHYEPVSLSIKRINESIALCLYSFSVVPLRGNAHFCLPNQTKWEWMGLNWLPWTERHAQLQREMPRVVCVCAWLSVVDRGQKGPRLQPGIRIKKTQWNLTVMARSFSCILTRSVLRDGELIEPSNRAEVYSWSE